jgi:membrane protein required for colicin V production
MADERESLRTTSEVTEMPSYLDLGLIVIILISALLSMVRGFTREVLAIGSWAAAAAAAALF